MDKRLGQTPHLKRYTDSKKDIKRSSAHEITELQIKTSM